MPQKKDNVNGNDDKRVSLVPAMIARTRQEAEQYCQLLGDHDIPAGIGDEETIEKNADDQESSSRSIPQGVPVLVPKDMLDEATEIIADCEDVEDFQLDDDMDDLDDDDEFGFGEEMDLDLEDDDEDDLFFDDDDEDL